MIVRCFPRLSSVARELGFQTKCTTGLPIDTGCRKSYCLLRMKTRFAPLLVAAVAVLLAGSLTDGRAIGITNTQGRMIELGSLTGVVTHVDLSKHKFTLTWKGKGALKMERYWPSYREDYTITDSTVYKNGSLAKLQNGARVRISGRSYTASVVQFLGAQPAFNAEVLPISCGRRVLRKAKRARSPAVPWPLLFFACGQTWLLP